MFSVAQAREAGVGASRLLQPDLRRPFHGVRMRAAPPSDTGPRDALFDESPVAAEARILRAEIQLLARALSTVWGDGWFLSHTTAAVLWELPLPIRLLRRCVENLDVAVRGARRAPRGRGIRGHQLAPELVNVRGRDGLAMASPASVWAQLAPDLSIGELIELGDAIVYIPRRRGMERGDEGDALGTIDQLTAAMDAGRRTGAARLRAALPHICVGAASPGETRIRLGVLAAGLPRPELDYDVVARDGSGIGFTELAHPKFRLLHEYEGDQHRLDRRQWNRDIEKHAACVAEGWDVTRLTAAHAYPTTAPAVAKIRGALVRAGWRP
ncbi:hypothetical protein [Microbacterium sp.]|uniref:hypothetical protein n=1 Tax=Microbacterium sp. TaxID=51671 RepID=UPI0039E6BE08